MFGYIRVSKPELKIKEFEMYKAVYCSLCKKLGKDYGILSRFILNYDFTFTALLELALKDGGCPTQRKRCTFNPFKKCNYCCQTEPFSLSAGSLVILSYYKISDDIDDEKGLKKLWAVILKQIMKSPFKKAAKKYPLVAHLSENYYREQRLAESKENCSLDEAALPSSNMLSALLPLYAEKESDKKVLSFLGKLLGRYIYLLDCLLDREKDIKKDNFNPIKNLDYDNAKEKIKTQIYIVINEAEKAFELLDIKKFKDILGNIIYVGLEDTMNTEINRLENKK